MNTTPADPRNEHGDDPAFGWLAGDAGHPHHAAAEIPPAAESIEPHDSGHLLDSLAVNTLINRGLMIALCLIVVAVTFEGVKVLTTGGDIATQIVPSAIEPATKPTKATPTTKPRAAVPVITTTTTQPVPATVPTTAPISTVARNTTPITAPQQIARATTPPQTAPTQPIVVPFSTPPTTAPHDTVQVPFTPGK